MQVMVHVMSMQPCIDTLWSSATSCLQISCHSDGNLSMYADVGWVGDPCDRIYIAGYILSCDQILSVGPLGSNNQLLGLPLKQNTNR
ncbi:hypothetical protein KY290_036931 [Solanum tuberosum]|uniref:Uncharacterized protein n=1 Tax=Solanum tuberosum TaxID=4113 RepID=A0ABQ7TVS7_SOLTU|nr:hypothetical protein KY284_036293 [Solanum tuberosum]KAH0738226.1 hypothetical protein KY290_036931 [Solanum tuberosum]